MARSKVVCCLLGAYCGAIPSTGAVTIQYLTHAIGYRMCTRMAAPEHS